MSSNKKSSLAFAFLVLACAVLLIDRVAVPARTALADIYSPSPLWCPPAADTGSANALAATVPGIPATIQNGQCVLLKVAGGNSSSGATTFNLTPTGGSAYGAIAVNKRTTAGLAAIANSADITAAGFYELIYDSVAAVWILNSSGNEAYLSGANGAGQIILGNSNNQLQSSAKLIASNTTGLLTTYGNIATVSPGAVVPRAVISLTGQTAAITTATLCTAALCGNATAGAYNVDVYVDSTVTCATPGPAVVGVTLTWTDETGTKSAQTVPLDVNGATSLSGTLALGTTTGNATGHVSFWTTGTIIQYATTYTACTSGTGTYALRIAVTNVGQ